MTNLNKITEIKTLMWNIEVDYEKDKIVEA